MIILVNKQSMSFMFSCWFFCLFLLAPVLTKAQKQSEFSVPSLMNSKLDLDAGVTHFKSLYDFKKGEKIASVGAGTGSREVIYSMMADSLTMYIQDIDTTFLKSAWITQLAIRQYTMAELPITASFVLVTGTANETRLPKATLDKVILEHSLHEFTQQTQMITDIRTKMKPNGLLFVWELMARRPGRKHPVCKKPMLTEGQLLELMGSTGFKLVRSVRVFRDVPKGRLYTFSLAEHF